MNTSRLLLNLGGIYLHDQAPPINAFIEMVFEQLKQGKTEITFGFSDAMASPEYLQKAFTRMNP